MRLLVCAACVAALGVAADRSAGLLSAAAKGQTEHVRALLEGGASIEAADRDGRTPLMLAAQHGRLETVRLLLDRGARPGARDSSGLTAWGLAMFSPAGHGDREGVLKALPKPPPVPIGLAAGWSPSGLVSSCFMNREQLVWTVRSFRFDSLAINEFARYATSPAARGLVELKGAIPLGMRGGQQTEVPEADALVSIEIHPGAACSGQSDNLSLAIAVSVVRARDHSTVFERSFAGALKGLKTQAVDNPRQYQPVWEAWIKSQIEPMYWATAAALARGVP